MTPKGGRRSGWRDRRARRLEASLIHRQIEKLRGALISTGDRRDDGEIDGLYRAGQVAQEREDELEESIEEALDHDAQQRDNPTLEKDTDRASD